MAEILFAEDDADVRKWVAIALETEGHAVRTAPDGAAALAAYAAHRPDLLMLDVMMPRRDGLSVCAEIRRADPALPILMLSARNTEKDKVRGLGAGADDYLTKPFGLEELFARIAALLRRASLIPPSRHTSFKIGAHVVDGARLAVVAPDGTATPLAAREYELLRLLAAHPGEVLRRDRLLDEIWGVTFYGNTRTLDQHVALIRRKLGADAARIETVRNVGYRLAP
ncbi:MAG: response regulator transcription factor [Kiritimatiellia bacterium]